MSAWSYLAPIWLLAFGACYLAAAGALVFIHTHTPRRRQEDSK